MKAFYQDDLVTIYHADYRAWVGPLDVACALVDPPYEETGLAWDKWPAGWPQWLLERMPPTASLWCWGTLRMFMDRRDEFAGYRLAQDVIWEKNNGSSLHADRFRRVHEQPAQFYPKTTAWGDVYKSPVMRAVEEERKRKPIERCGKPAHWGDINRETVGYEYDGTRLARSVIYAPAVRHGVRHATPKPVSVQRDLVSYSTPPQGTVLDIFCGSGSALCAAKELGRRAIGFDGDIEAVTESAERCSQTMSFPAP